jgi:sodium/pantothenate symporter
MMIAAGLCSAGRFSAAPVSGYKLGATWVLVRGAQNFMTFIVLGEVGKKIGIVARRIGAQSIFGLLLHRYNRNNKLIGVFGVVRSLLHGELRRGADRRRGEALRDDDRMSYELGLVLFSASSWPSSRWAASRAWRSRSSSRGSS